MPPKEMTWKEEDGTKYKISYSEELQLRNLRATRKQIIWQKRNFYVMIFLIAAFIVLTLIVVYTLYRLDQIDFFTRIAYR